MKRMLRWILVGMTTMAAIAPAFAQTVGSGPYYATPSWDQKLQCDTQATCPRFIVLANWNNDAVLDRETGLVWERSPSSQAFTWNFDAVFHCNDLRTGNRAGWRLPTIQELASLFDVTLFSLPAGHPFNNIQPGTYFASATILRFDPGFVWGVNVNNGTPAVGNRTTDSVAVWCVRGGQGNSDAQ